MAHRRGVGAASDADLDQALLGEVRFGRRVEFDAASTRPDLVANSVDRPASTWPVRLIDIRWRSRFQSPHRSPASSSRRIPVAGSTPGRRSPAIAATTNRAISVTAISAGCIALEPAESDAAVRDCSRRSRTPSRGAFCARPRCAPAVGTPSAPLATAGEGARRAAVRVRPNRSAAGPALAIARLMTTMWLGVSKSRSREGRVHCSSTSSALGGHAQMWSSSAAIVPASRASS